MRRLPPRREERAGGANLEANEELKKKLMHEMMVDAYVERI